MNAQATPWTETDGPDQERVLSFAGIDQDLQDTLDIENFASASKTVAKEDEGGKAFARGSRMRSRAMTPMDAVRFGLACVFLLVALWVTQDLVTVSDGAAMAICFGAFFLGALTPWLVTLAIGRRARPVVRSSAATFHLRVSPRALQVEGPAGTQSYDLADIAAVTGAPRLVLERRDGARITLSCRLPGPGQSALAARLNELVARARSTTAGYR